MSEDTNLPAVQNYDDGYDYIPVDDRLIKGGILRCNVLDTGNSWQLTDKSPAHPGPYLAPMTKVVVQRWHNNRPAETIYEKRNEPIDLEALNAQIPESEWALGFDNKTPRPPWQRQWVVYLMNPTTGEWLTYLGGTIGAKIGVEELQDAVAWMRRLRGERVIPVVELKLGSFRTKFGPRPRPKFAIQRYVEAGADITAQAQIEHKPADPRAGLVEGYPADHGNVTNKMKAVAEPTTAEWIEDDIPDCLK